MTKELKEALINYLASKPYGEVYKLIGAVLQVEIEEQKETEKEE